MTKPNVSWKFGSGLGVLVLLLALSLPAITPALAAVVTINPGTVWTDTTGNVIQAHGEGIIKVGSTYYWLGEDKTNGSPFQNIKCYSSTDLKNWTFVNNVLTQQASGDLGPNRIVERPHVIYNSSTAQYVMYMHIDNTSYSERRAGTATSSSVCGNYTYRGSVKPLGHDSLDDTLFQDGSNGYFISEDRTSAKLQIYQLSADYLTVSSLVATLPQYESPALVKIGGTYFLFGSHLTGWNTNDNQYTTATSLAGPWSTWKSFAPTGTNTCNSQTTFILPVQGSSTTTYMFLGDRWSPSSLWDSRYIWEPLTINGTTVTLTCYSSWTIDAATGAWGAGALPTYYTLVNRKSAKLADVNGASTADGATVIQWLSNGGLNQQWEVVEAGGGYNTITNRNSGKCLEVANNSTADGAIVDQWTCNGGTNQKWQKIAVGSYSQFKAQHSAKCLDVSGGSTADGAQIVQLTCNTGSTSQQWTQTYISGPTPTPGSPTQTPTRTNTPTGPTATPTRTPTPGAVTNLALNKPASADSFQTANPIASGNDGSTTTRWCANDGNLNHWWKVDLGASHALTGSEVMWEFSGRVYKYKVEVSTDNTNWTLVVDKTNNTSTAQTQTDNFTATARYVRITVTGLASATWASFFEFRVFGT